MYLVFKRTFSLLIGSAQLNRVFKKPCVKNMFGREDYQALDMVLSYVARFIDNVTRYNENIHLRNIHQRCSGVVNFLRSDEM